MSKLTHSPTAIIKIFTDLCLNQVKEQLTENLTYFIRNPESFIHNGDLFTFVNNRSFILDESLAEYGIKLNFSRTLN